MDDAKLMRRAIEIASRGRGRVEPNPMVACVLARDGEIIAEGFHEYFGGPHAEPNALAVCSEPAGATAYVTLEPCCHRNKKTPPCVKALIGAKISRVVAACEDENPFVTGKGFAELRDAGIRVDQGLMQAESRQLNAAYSKLVSHHRPYVTLKWAQTADGKIAGASGKTLAISNAKSLEKMHRLRSRCDAVLVGIGTVLADNPLLTARVENPPRRAIRVVLDSNLRIPLDSRLVQSASSTPLRIYCRQETLTEKQAIVDSLRSKGVEIKSLNVDPGGKLSLTQLLTELGGEKLTHLLVEPGAVLAQTFLRQNIADRVWIFQSKKKANAESAPAASAIDFPSSGNIALDQDQLTEYLNPGSPVFFKNQASVDLS